MNPYFPLAHATIFDKGISWISNLFLLFNFRCAIPGYVNDTYEVQGEFHHRLINESIPFTTEGEYEKCQLYVNGGSNLTVKTESCTSWVYDKSSFTDTLGAKVIFKWTNGTHLVRSQMN